MNNRRLQYLISRWLDEAIEPEEFSSLQAMLKESAEARRVYLASIKDDAELFKLVSASREHLQMPTGEAVSTGEAGEPKVRSDSAGRGITIAPRTLLAFFAFAAGLLLALGIWRGTGLWKQELAQGEAVGKQLVTDELAMDESSMGEPSILAKIEPMSDACRWYAEPARHLQDEPYQTGDIIRVTSGKLGLHYANGTTVVLHSPSAYQLISEKDARMLAGRLTATVSEAGKGFSVVTPRMTVIDLGTQFGVEVDDRGATDLVVFQGEVDVDFHDDQVRTQRLQMGEAVHLDAAGTTSRIVSINSSTYSSDSLRELSRPLVITQVHDNINERSPTLSYYEIVHGGMGEDVFAYVDRPLYVYMGLTDKGLPPYLLGGDYVKMFNDDKTNQDFQIDLHMAVPARLYILLDDKIEPPQWLRSDFRDTGDSIGMDRGIPRQEVFHEGVLQNNEIPAGALSRVQVNMVIMFSVWVRDSVDAGVITLGATEVEKIASNMYGIVAVPLEEIQ